MAIARACLLQEGGVPFEAHSRWLDHVTVRLVRCSGLATLEAPTVRCAYVAGHSHGCSCRRLRKRARLQVKEEGKRIVAHRMRIVPTKCAQRCRRGYGVVWVPPSGSPHTLLVLDGSLLPSSRNSAATHSGGG